MCDVDLPPDKYYNPECPLDSDDEFDATADPFSVLASTTNRIRQEQSSPPSLPPDDACHSNDDNESTECRSPTPVPVPKVFTDLFCVKRYTKEDLYPTELDPQCYPAWSLSPYWPVYVSNFRLNILDESERNIQIATYFASKGLLSRMIFIRDEEDLLYRHLQKKTFLVDMLVYFTCEDDVDRAIRCCDKTTYYGHTLNVLPGRIPVYFDPERTVCFQVAKRSIHITETYMERWFQQRGCENIDTIVKHSDGEMIVEFSNPGSMNVAVAQRMKWIPSRLAGPTRKQRYLEQDLKYEMMFRINENPSILDMLPPEFVLNDLLNGRLPPVLRDWDNWPTPKPLPLVTLERLDAHKVYRKRRLLDNYQARKKAKASGLPVAPKNPGSMRQHKKEVVRQQEAFLNLTRPPPTRMERVEYIRRNFKRLLEPYETTRTTLLTEKEVPTLAIRNKLFYDLFKLEQQLTNLIEKNCEFLECEFLDHGLNVAIIVAGEQLDFPQYPSDLAHSDEEEPLDTLWPVFVANFPVTDLGPKLRNQEVCDFFAAKGFAVQMVYLNTEDKFYNSYLKIVKLLDMLVYFDSEEVAKQVSKTYHVVMHSGSKLGVNGGRRPFYFRLDCVQYLKLDKDPIVAEQSIQRVLVNIAPETLHSLGRYPKRAVFSFWRKRHWKVALACGLPLTWTPKLRPKQRFLEKDVKQDLLRRILNDADFLNDQPNPDALRQLFVAASVPSEEEGGEIVWVGDYQKRKDMNERIRVVLAEWEKLQ